MDSGVAKDPPLRRSSRLSTANDSPGKRSRMGMEAEDDIEMDEELENKDQESDIRVNYNPAEMHRGAHGDMNLFPRVALGQRCQSNHTVREDGDSFQTRIVKPPPKTSGVPTKPAMQINSPEHRHDAVNLKVTSMAEYKKTMEAKAKSSDVNHYPPRDYPAPEKSCTRRHVNNLPKGKDAGQYKKQERKLEKTPVIKKSSGHASRGFLWYLCCLVVLVLLGSAVFFAYKSFITQKSTIGGGVSSFRAAKPELFSDQLSLLESQFPSQRLDVWKRSKIHLEKHLRTAQPTGPVSLIFAAGLKAERTLSCLAQGVASAYSSALNASVLHFDGASKANRDSDEVKLDIDRQLQAAFGGDKPAVVIHRFEELPPGSTIIFYRYCDHDNAAYKQVFLLFTVLLPQDEVGAEVGLVKAEEIVLDYVKERLLEPTSQTAFNTMDNDKFGGLWSRISHLILPVVSEEEVEQKGCPW
ncbi:torsin-1A-interacting protein 1-like [Xyrichtys novacula]|uniref:Torsin-1A-interacting protein 1-like n=1 Tax=Xyrichtys novacula TaxID=13765 RepID=A0AAV1FIA7_XYRNO|nr:torsin-1A-interacting protein 1-like [Xyrichtys novacula]